MTTHVDTLMGHESQEMRRLREQLKKEREAAIAEAKALHAALSDLVKAPGWKVFERYCQDEHQRIMDKLDKCNDPTTLAKLVGVNIAVEAFPRWPAQQLAQLTETLKEG